MGTQEHPRRQRDTANCLLSAGTNSGDGSTGPSSPPSPSKIDTISYKDQVTRRSNPIRLLSLVSRNNHYYVKQDDESTSVQSDGLFTEATKSTSTFSFRSHNKTSPHGCHRDKALDQTAPRARMRRLYDAQHTKEALGEEFDAILVQHKDGRDQLLTPSSCSSDSSELPLPSLTTAGSSSSPPTPPPNKMPNLAPMVVRGAVVSPFSDLEYSLDKEETSPLSRSGRTRRTREIVEVAKRFCNGRLLELTQAAAALEVVGEDEEIIFYDESEHTENTRL